MGKRSAFPRVERDFYPTPRAAVLSLIPHLRAGRVRRFAEPCAGAGDLVRHLEEHGLKCVYAGDISDGQDAFACESFSAPVITNPPWTRNVLHPLIAHFMQAAPFAWLLFDADWAHTGQSISLINHCSLIVPIGRLRWIPDSPHTGKDNCAWHRFSWDHTAGPAFCGRLPAVSPVPDVRLCQHCAEPYRPQRSDSRFCCGTCRQRAHRARVGVTQP
jgi:hypothetical protein